VIDAEQVAHTRVERGHQRGLANGVRAGHGEPDGPSEAGSAQPVPG
jgi:hypothetical protein